ncbi:MAG: hypothetical protein A2Y38_06725 [Spirochaetes bacterium GWB1_59_5]|nr:MAG: hypothetical protein A2Y38_06725 [Spirochaetes bacterium GWB1_59_5]
MLPGKVEALAVFSFVEDFLRIDLIGRQTAQGVMRAGVLVEYSARYRVMEMFKVRDGLSEKIAIFKDLVDGFDHRV